MALQAFLNTPSAGAYFSESSFLQAMLDFEAALVLAQADAGMVTVSQAEAVAGVCKLALLDAASIVEQSVPAGSLAIPLVKHLTEAVALFNKDAAGVVHLGATSQDVLDTAMVLQTRKALAHIDHQLALSIDMLDQLIQSHRATPCLARTLMQPATVVAFGYKLLSWYEPLLRVRAALGEVASLALCLQFGGATGTRAALGEHAAIVLRQLAARLNLRPSLAGEGDGSCWHTQRDVWMRLGAELGIFCGVAGKIGRDVALLSQAEIAELAEASGPGKGGSSAMPHKRNSVGAMLLSAAAIRAPQRVAALLACMGQEQERGLGNWQAEMAEFASLVEIALGVSNHLVTLLQGLEVNALAMQANIDNLRGLTFAESVVTECTPLCGKALAHQWVESVCRRLGALEGSLKEALVVAVKNADAPQALVNLPKQDWLGLLDRAFDLGRAMAASQSKIHLRPQPARDHDKPRPT